MGREQGSGVPQWQGGGVVFRRRHTKLAMPLVASGTEVALSTSCRT